MTPRFETESQLARQAVLLASRICQSVQSKMTSEHLDKKDKSPVTIADYASQAVICRTLSKGFPNDPIVGEEDSADLQLDSNASFREEILQLIQDCDIDCNLEEVLSWIDLGNHDGTSQRFWTLDPIDGTKGFLRKEQYAVSLALIVDGVIEVAALACPNLQINNPELPQTGVVFQAVRGQGAWCSPLEESSSIRIPVQVSQIDDAVHARLCESVESGHSDRGQSANILSALNTSAAPVRLDSQAKYGVVACGDADLYLRLPTRPGYEEKIWDHAGGVLVIEEAGGKVTDLHGKPLDFSAGRTLRNNHGVVATNSLLHEIVLKAAQSQMEL